MQVQITFRVDCNYRGAGGIETIKAGTRHWALFDDGEFWVTIDNEEYPFGPGEVSKVNGKDFHVSDDSLFIGNRVVQFIRDVKDQFEVLSFVWEKRQLPYVVGNIRDVYEMTTVTVRDELVGNEWRVFPDVRQLVKV